MNYSNLLQIFHLLNKNTLTILAGKVNLFPMHPHACAHVVSISGFLFLSPRCYRLSAIL